MHEEKITADRLATYSDAVFAVIVTIMVLELRAPDQAAFSDLWPLWPTAISYAVSYLFIAIIWINHHYLMRFVGPPTLGLIWINFLHLFMVSLLPFATAWIARTRLGSSPVAFYAGLFVCIDVAYNKVLAHANATQVPARMRRMARRRSLVARRPQPAESTSGLPATPAPKRVVSRTAKWSTLLASTGIVGVVVAFAVDDVSPKLGWFLFATITCTSAMFCGYSARRQIRSFPAQLRCLWLCRAGLLLSYAGVAGCALLAAILDASHGFSVASESNAVDTLRTIGAAQMAYKNHYGAFACNLMTLGPPPEGDNANASFAGLVSGDIASGYRGGYFFEVHCVKRQILSAFETRRVPVGL